MSSQHHVLLKLSCVLLVLLIHAPGTQSRPSTEETDTGLTNLDSPIAPQWLNPQQMERGRQSVRSGRPVKFRCKAIGNPVPTLRWFKNGKNITKDQRQRGIKIRYIFWTLKIESVFLPDSGNYTCVVENKHGRLEHTFQLDVYEVHYSRPVLKAGLPANQTAAVGSDVTFECKVLSGTQVHMQWLKHITRNGSRYGQDGVPHVQVLKSCFQYSSSNEDIGVLTLKNITLGDAGVYTCLVGNSVGMTHQTAWLTVIERVPPYEKTAIFPHVIRWAFDVLFG